MYQQGERIMFTTVFQGLELPNEMTKNGPYAEACAYRKGVEINLEILKNSESDIKAKNAENLDQENKSKKQLELDKIKSKIKVLEKRKRKADKAVTGLESTYLKELQAIAKANELDCAMIEAMGIQFNE